MSYNRWLDVVAEHMLYVLQSSILMVIGNYKKRFLNFCIVLNHKGETIGKIIKQCLHGRGIDKVFTIDNAYSNNSALKEITYYTNF